MEVVEKPREKKIWELLIPNDRAESLMKRAEILSAEGRTRGSIQAFRQAVKLFGEIERFLDVRDWEVEDPEEVELINKMKKTVRLKRKYCLARINEEKRNSPWPRVER